MSAAKIRQKKLLEQNLVLRNVLREVQHLIAPFIDINANETRALVINQQNLAPRQPVENINTNESSKSMDVLQYLRLQKVPSPEKWPAQTQPRSDKPIDFIRKREQVMVVLDRLKPEDIVKFTRESKIAIRKRPNSKDQSKQRPMPKESQRQRYPRKAAPTNLVDANLRDKIIKKVR